MSSNINQKWKERRSERYRRWFIKHTHGQWHLYNNDVDERQVAPYYSDWDDEMDEELESINNYLFQSGFKLP